MVCCAAFGCANRSDKRKKKSTNSSDDPSVSKITFHLFPKNSTMRQKWVNAVKRANWQPSNCSVLCSIHFSEDSFDRTSMHILRLRPGTVPCIFPGFPSHLQEALPKRSVKRKRKLPNIPPEVPIYNTSICPDVVTDDTITVDTHFEEMTIPEIQIIEEHPQEDPLGSLPLLSKSTSFSPDRKYRSPSRAKTRIHFTQKMANYRIKMGCLQANKWKSSKISNTKYILRCLKIKHFLLEDNINVLRNISGANTKILKRQMTKSCLRVPKVYNADLRRFALTLHYYSPRAYNYVRESFNTCLPHPKRISKWYKSIDGTPGFTTESLNYIQQMVTNSAHTLLGNLIVDEVAVCKHLDYDGTQVTGYVDMGSGLYGDDQPLAKEALVFMVVCMNGSWKIPIGYFLLDGISAEQKTNLIIQGLFLTHEAGLRIVSITFDCLASNCTMARLLGCQLDVAHPLITFVPHPVTGLNIYIMPDPSHMLELVRKTLVEKHIIFDENNNAIMWDYIKELQDGEELHLANKIRDLHMNFYKQKMKVRLASQVFSNSVADALTVCKNDLKLEQFKDCEATIKFIKLFNNLFDIFNSKSLLQQGFKKSFTCFNYKDTFAYLNSCSQYISKLAINKQEDLIVQSCRKTGFLGFLICIQSLKNMFEELCRNERQEKLLTYIPTYKMSLDHLELFFGVIRMHGGSNNNPTAKQFIAAYKDLMHLEPKVHDKGNCMPLEEISVLHCRVLSSEMRINLSIPGYRLIEETLINNEEKIDHIYLTSVQKLTNLSKHVIRYLGGFVVKYLNKTLHCQQCLNALMDTSNKPIFLLTSTKDRGGLICPSTDVINICQSSEKLVMQALTESGGKILNKKITADNLTSGVLHFFLEKAIFIDLQLHSRNQAPLDNHAILLIKAVATKYIDIRLHYIAKSSIDKSNSMRQLFNKIILFSGN